MHVQILWQDQKAVLTIVEFEFFDIFYSKFQLVSTFSICSKFCVENWLLCCDLICKWVTCRSGCKRFWKSALHIEVMLFSTGGVVCMVTTMGRTFIVVWIRCYFVRFWVIQSYLWEFTIYHKVHFRVTHCHYRHNNKNTMVFNQIGPVYNIEKALPTEWLVKLVYNCDQPYNALHKVNNEMTNKNVNGKWKFCGRSGKRFH